MYDDEMRTVVSREALAKQGTAAVMDLAGGLALLIMAMGGRLKFLGVVVSLAALIFGISILSSRDRREKKPGIFITIAGSLGMIGQFGLMVLRPFTGFILGLGGFYLLAGGIIKGIKFLFGLGSRS